MKKVIIPVVIAILLAGGIGGYFLFSKSSKASASQDKKEDAVKHPAETLELPEFIVNLADKGRPHYLKTTIVIEFSGPEAHEKVKEATPYIRDKMLTTLSRQEYAILLTQEGKESLKKELLDCTQEVLSHGEEEPEIEVSNILFTSFVMD